jgi:hypothetical protein
VAETLKRELGVDVILSEGDDNEFTVWVDDALVAKRGWVRLPADGKVVKAVREALAAGSHGNRTGG